MRVYMYIYIGTYVYVYIKYVCVEVWVNIESSSLSSFIAEASSLLRSMTCLRDLACLAFGESEIEDPSLGFFGCRTV